MVTCSLSFSNGQTNSSSATNQCASLIIGNVDDIRECSEDDIQKWINKQEIVDAMTRNRSKQR